MLKALVIINASFKSYLRVNGELRMGFIAWRTNLPNLNYCKILGLIVNFCFLLISHHFI